MGHSSDPVVAKQVVTTSTHLVVITRQRQHEIPWERCSPKLAQAGLMERSRAELSPSGYSIYWPLLDEDLAVGPLILEA